MRSTLSRAVDAIWADIAVVTDFCHRWRKSLSWSVNPVGPPPTGIAEESGCFRESGGGIRFEAGPGVFAKRGENRATGTVFVGSIT